MDAYETDSLIYDEVIGSIDMPVKINDRGAWRWMPYLVPGGRYLIIMREFGHRLEIWDLGKASDSNPTLVLTHHPDWRGEYSGPFFNPCREARIVDWDKIRLLISFVAPEDQWENEGFPEWVQCSRSP